MQHLRHALALGMLAALALAALPAPTPGQAAPIVSTIAAPVLKWQRGGCFSNYCQTGWYASPAVADLDGDGKNEVIWGSYDVVALNGATGALKWRGAASTRVWPGLAVADLTGDGSPEVIAGRGGDLLTVYNSAGGVLWTAHPFGEGEIRTLAVDDLESDGQLEIVVGLAASTSDRQLSVYEPNGSVRPGWPARRQGEDGYGTGMYNENVAVGDLNGDGLKEIYGPTDTHYITALDRNGNQLAASALFGAGKPWSKVGVAVLHEVELQGYADCGDPQAPFARHLRPNFANSAPAIADLDSDGARELVVPGDVYNCDLGDPDGDLYHLPWVYEYDRTRWKSASYDWTTIPAAEPGSGPLSQDYSVIQNSATNAVTADLDGDGKLEILYPSYDGRLHAYWLDKTEHGGWPYDVPGSGIRFASEPAVADLDGDGQAEVIFSSWPENGGGRVGQLHILDYLGNPLHALNLPAPFGDDWNGGLGAPTVANIDADADMEVVVGTSASGVVAYDLPGTAGAQCRWCTGRGSNRRTGAAAVGPSFTLSASPGVRAVARGGTASYRITIAAEGGFGANVAFSLSAPGGVSAQIAPGGLTPPGQATLTVTDSSPAGPSLPGAWRTLTVSATGGGKTRSTSVKLLVGGAQTFLPLVRRP